MYNIIITCVHNMYIHLVCGIYMSMYSVGEIVGKNGSHTKLLILNAV